MENRAVENARGNNQYGNKRDVRRQGQASRQLAKNHERKTNDALRQIFSANLLYLMDRDGLVQTDLAVITNYSKTTVMRWMDGTHWPQASALRKLCDLFKVDARILFEPLEEMK